MEIFHAFILGIVEGITEFLPVSSTGHLILTSHLLGMPQTDFVKSFEIAIQVGAILAVVVLYWRVLLVGGKVLRRIIAAFIPTAVLGLLFYKVIKRFLLGNSQVVLWSLFLGGIALIVFELFHKEREGVCKELSDVTYGQALLIGVAQSAAMVPGVSRSAATILGGLALGLPRKMVVEFSFLLAVPTMLAAAALDLFKNAAAFSADQSAFLAIGFGTSFVVALLSIKFLLYFIQRHSFILFGVYRIFIALCGWTLFSGALAAGHH